VTDDYRKVIAATEKAAATAVQQNAEVIKVTLIALLFS